MISIVDLVVVLSVLANFGYTYFNRHYADFLEDYYDEQLTKMQSRLEMLEQQKMINESE